MYHKLKTILYQDNLTIKLLPLHFSNLNSITIGREYRGVKMHEHPSIEFCIFWENFLKKVPVNFSIMLHSLGKRKFAPALIDTTSYVTLYNYAVHTIVTYG